MKVVFNDWPENIVVEAQKAFCDLMRKGWVNPDRAYRSGPKKLAGFEFFHANDVIYSLVDIWSSVGHFGVTSLLICDTPFWAMQYGGFCQKEAVDLLKKALLFNYKNRQFLGGRGPKSFPELQFHYTNFCDGDFAHFHGREDVVMSEVGVICTTNYSGGFLVSHSDFREILKKKLDQNGEGLDGEQPSSCPSCGKPIASHGVCLPCLACAKPEDVPKSSMPNREESCPQCNQTMVPHRGILKCLNCGETVKPH